MLDDVRNFLGCFRESLESDFKLPDWKIENIVIAGMGGSGIAGFVAKDAFKEELKVPVEISRSCSLPAFADEKTLVICNSYSGNTWETLSQLDQALGKGLKAVCITSGGKMEEIAKERGLPLVRLPGGMMPRVAFPHSIGATLAILQRMGLVSVPELKTLENSMESIEKGAKRLAESINGTLPVMISEELSVAFRWKSQLNENSKCLGKAEDLPEIHHNDVESWNQLDKRFSVILLRKQKERKEIANSFNIDREILSERTNVHEVLGKGSSKLEMMLHLIVFGDFVSYFISELNNIDPYKIPVVDRIKSHLKKNGV